MITFLKLWSPSEERRSEHCLFGRQVSLGGDVN